MAAAAYHPPSSAMAHQQQHQPPQPVPGAAAAAATAPAPALRRAVYVHISDLISAYNIDHAMLEEELTRVKEETLKAAAVQQQHDKDGSNSNKEGDPATAASSSLDATGTAAGPVLGGVPTELDTNPSPKRLHPPRVGYNLCVLVGKVSVVVDKRRVDGSRVRLAEVEVGDETGIVSLRARDDQIDILEEVSKRAGAVVIRNCTLELYQGRHVRLAVTKWGKLSRYPDQIASTPPPPSKINRDRNFSLIDLSKVASEMVTYPAPQDPYQQHHPHTHLHPHHHHPGLEAENYANRPSQPSYAANTGRRGRRPPTSARPKGSPGHYGDPGLGGGGGAGAPTAGPMQVPAGSYPVAGLHGYGGIDAGPYLYATRPADSLSGHQQQSQRQQHQQHVMMHQQYDIQSHHRPLHQAPPPPPPPPPPTHMGGYGQEYPQDRMGNPSGLMNPGPAPGTVGYDPNNPFGMAMPSNPFIAALPPQSSGGAAGAMLGGAPAGSVGPGGIVRADSPHGKMNPQAATFDPVAFRK